MKANDSSAVFLSPLSVSNLKDEGVELKVVLHVELHFAVKAFIKRKIHGKMECLEQIAQSNLGQSGPTTCNSKIK